MSTTKPNSSILDMTEMVTNSTFTSAVSSGAAGFVASVLSSVAEAQAGTSNEVLMTPYRTSQLLWQNKLTMGTPQNTASGNSVVFGSIPDWVKRITVLFSEVSLTDVAYIQVVIGDAGGLETSGYVGSFGTLTHNTSPSILDLSTSFIAAVTGGGGSVVSGSITLTLLDAATYTWACHGALGRASEVILHTVAGIKSLSDVLTQVAVTTNGTFDAGKVNIIYE